DLDAIAKQTFARAECAFRGDADLVDASLARCRLDAVDQLGQAAVENVRRAEQIGPKGDEEVAIVARMLRAGSGEHSQRLYHQRQPKTLVPAERQQSAAACQRGVRGWLATRPDG